MGAYSTKTISRSKAVQMYNEKQKCRLSNEELEEELFKLYGDQTLYNYRVIDDEDYSGDLYDY
jgi:hypothetical protein